MKKYTIKATDKEGFFPTPYTNKFFAHSDAEALQQAREYYAFYFNSTSAEVNAEIIHSEPASEIELCTYNHILIQRKVGDRFACIVRTNNSKELGVQYWTQEMIKQGAAQNTDRTVSQFVTLL